MDELIKDTNENAVEQQEQSVTDNAFKDAIEGQLKKIQSQGMLIGFQTALQSVLAKIITTKQKPGKTTLRDYERLMKDIEQFCMTGLERKIEDDDDSSNETDNPTVQN